ncbi:MAG: cation:proton antiporter [Candidatus Altiarchaeales archaeon]|nr:MAG: cation:proton antiporter [Candidatus Altiarchaeales archaeon]
MLLLEFITLVLIFTAFLCLYRVVVGPRAGGRIIAVNVIGTKTVVLLVLIGFIYDSLYFVDVALVYALFNFIMTLAVSKYLEMGRI